MRRRQPEALWGFAPKERTIIQCAYPARTASPVLSRDPEATKQAAITHRTGWVGVSGAFRTVGGLYTLLPRVPHYRCMRAPSPRFRFLVASSCCCSASIWMFISAEWTGEGWAHRPSFTRRSWRSSVGFSRTARPPPRSPTGLHLAA